MTWQATRCYKIGLAIALIAAIILVALVNQFAYFPGDVSLAKSIQAILPPDTAWATTLSNFSKFPLYFILLALTIFFALICSGVRAAMLAPFSFAGLWLLDKFLRLFIFQPRPVSSLINVAEPSASSGFPSTAAMIYMGTFGFLLLLSLKFCKGSAINKIVFLISALVLVAVFLARIVLGAHWPSDLLISYLLGTVWILFLLPFISPNSFRASV